MSNKLTIKQENFCVEYMKHGNASEAYRQAYDVEGMTEKSVNEEACRLTKNLNVSSRLDEERRKLSERNCVTIESITKEFERDRELARQVEQLSVAVKATEHIAKMHGVYKEAPTTEIKIMPQFLVIKNNASQLMAETNDCD